MKQQDDQRWAALLRRDPAADGEFVYSVATTGVYCRPACPSRLALRANIRFHDTCADAEREGFRPCKRCRPNEASQNERHAEAVRRACLLIDEAEMPPSLDALSEAAGLSRFHFLRVFRKMTGLTPRQYAEQKRAARMRAGLRGGTSVTDAIYNAGFSSGSRFYEKAPELLGMEPRQFQRGGAGVAIGYAVTPCALGLVLVAGTERGVCAVRFGDAEQALIDELGRDFPRASITRADAGFNRYVEAVVNQIEHPGRSFDLPLDLQGTLFQQRVWRALRDIPAGKTESYTEVAARVGQPSAVRAVARACATNPAAVVVPCHRVVRADGGLSGYRWGTERKRKLLEREGAR
jgi:AraC family transcriptional regulator of adaptative response/methylated-DNA-[protein]-cysteine methyltransferase